jgi:hypothetical protein
MKPVKPELDLLVDELEKERRSLKKMIRDAASEHDNLIVYYLSEALLDLNRQMNVLYCFKDPLYKRKEELKRRIGFLKNMPYLEMSKQLRVSVKEYYAKDIAEMEAELKKLNDQPNAVYKKTQYIDDALFALYEKRCKSFKLIIWADNNTALHFKIKKKQLIITLNNKSDFWEADFIVHDRAQDSLKGMGFKFDEQRKMYFYTYEMTGFNNASPIKMWLSHFLVDYWHLYGSAGSVTLVYQ